MKLIVGLGNPGRQYAGTRHNVGFEIADRLAERFGTVWESAPRGIEALVARDRGRDVLVAKPLTFMNASGPAVLGLVQFFKIELSGLLVVVDDVHLDLGRLRARASGSAGGHNGLKSLIASLGTDAFARLRAGVGRGDRWRGMADHVLARFDPSERPVVIELVDRAADAAELFTAEGIAAAMNRFNRKEEKPEETATEDTD